MNKSENRPELLYYIHNHLTIFSKPLLHDVNSLITNLLQVQDKILGHLQIVQSPNLRSCYLSTHQLPLFHVSLFLSSFS